MKEQIKAPEKIQLSNEERANLSDAQFKTGNQEAQRIPKRLDPRKHTPKAHHNYISQEEK